MKFCLFNRDSGLLYRLALTGLPALMLVTACSVKPPVNGVNDMGSKRALLARVRQHHVLLVDKEFERYRHKFPRVSKADYQDVIKNKSRNWCIFSHFPVIDCKDLGDREYKRGRLKEARDAYRAVVLSEEYNKQKLNVKVLGSLTQISLDMGDMYNAQVYISKLLNINDNNPWAKKKLVEVLSTRN